MIIRRVWDTFMQYAYAVPMKTYNNKEQPYIWLRVGIRTISVVWNLHLDLWSKSLSV